jgi:hypothetical protein
MTIWDVPEQRNGSGQGYGHGSPQYTLVDPGSRYPWSVPFLNIRWEAEFSGYNVSWQICRWILIYLSLFQRR